MPKSSKSLTTLKALCAKRTALDKQILKAEKELADEAAKAQKPAKVIRPPQAPKKSPGRPAAGCKPCARPASPVPSKQARSEVCGAG